MDTLNKKIFFQSSLPRAGSTLLQNVMGQNPDFYVTPTSGVLELLYASDRDWETYFFIQSIHLTFH